MGTKIISIGQLKKGDIILSTTPDMVSKIVKYATSSKYSHARLYVGNGNTIEAIDPIVVEDKLIDLIKDDLYTAVYRYPNLNEVQKLQIIHYANQQLGKEYDLSGAVGTSNLGLLPILAAKIHNIRNAESDLYCSELIAFAYKSARVPLGTPSSLTTPKDLAQNPKLEYIGHLKTEIKKK
jgi:uncharacterized protein YycO